VALIYEAILLFGVVFVPAYLFSALTRFKGDPASPLHYGFQFTVFGAVGLYFVMCWRRSGQTLPMKTWKFRLVGMDGMRLSVGRCWVRYAMAWIGPLAGLAAYKAIVLIAGYGMARFSATAAFAALPLFMLNFAWAFADRERQFLHDRLAGTRLVSVRA
jgi:uncharacterized RDD family membrane protein YckC